MRPSIKIFTLIADVEKGKRLGIPPTEVEVKTRIFVDDIEGLSEDLNADGTEATDRIIIDMKSGRTHVAGMSFETLDKLIDKSYGIISVKKQSGNS